MRKDTILHYELGTMLDHRNLPSTSFHHPSQRLPFKCTRLPVCPRYVQEIQGKSANISLDLGKSDEFIKKKVELTETFEEIKVDPLRKDLDTEKEHWRLIIQERYRTSKNIPLVQAEQYLIDVYKQKQLELQRARLKDDSIILEATDTKQKIESKEIKFEEFKMRQKKINQPLQKLVAGAMLQKDQIEDDEVLPVKQKAKKKEISKEDKMKQLLIFSLEERERQEKLKKIEKLRMKEDYVLEQLDMLATTERSERIGKEEILKFKTFMQSGQKFLEYSELLTGRNQTIEIINLHTKVQ